jgi:SAM-dependent methyltransferase
VPTNYFDEHVAAGYDESSTDMFEPHVLDPAVDFLADLAGNGSALELGIGTGRVALPLSRRGVPVHGIELSPQMVEQLRGKPGADAIDVTIGDFATTRVDRTFKLAFVVYNTITNLTTQDEQVECFRNVAAHLEAGGRFVVEVFVPVLQRLPEGEVFRVFHRSPTRLSFDEYDVVTQILHSHHYWFDGGSYEVFPSELDLMARLAGMRLLERWSDWKRNPFTSESTSHVSVWEKQP